MISRLIAKRGAVLLIVVAIGAAALDGCSGNGPKSGAENYLNALKLFNYPLCYQLLSHQDQIDRTLEQFLTDVPMAPDVSRDWFKAVELHMQYEVGESKINGDQATVAVKVTMPDMATWERTVNAKVSEETPDQPNKDTPESLAQKTLTDNTYPKVTYEDSFLMEKEGDGWHVLYNFPLKEQLAKQHKQAVELYHKHDYDKAIAAYQEILAALDKTPATGNEGLKFKWGRELKEIQAVKEQMSEAQAYIPKLALKDVDMKMTASRVPGIFGRVTNGGDRAIDELQMTVTYYLGRGRSKKAVYTEEHTTIATPLEFTNFARNVLPFVPGEEREFGFKLTASPEIQQKATPDLTITQVVFTQSSAPLPKAPPPPTPVPTPAAGPAGAAGHAAAPASVAPAAAPPVRPLPPALPKG